MTAPAIRRLFSFPLISAAIIASVIAWMFATGHIARSFGAILLVLAWLLMTGCWWALRVPGRKLARLAALVVVTFIIGVAFKMLVRYDGSADGTALPRLAWRWQKTRELTSIAPAKKLAGDLASVPEGVADFTRFMGPRGDGVIENIGFSTDWKTHAPREVWRVPVGLGWSGFAVAGRRAITQEQLGDKECVTCRDVADGSLIWSHEDKARFSEQMGGDGPRATPTIDPEAKVVFTMGGTGILNCLDLETGAVKWSRHLLAESGALNPTWGKSCSPLLHGPHVIVTGGTTQPTVIALKRDTGADAWQSGGDSASYSSPVVLKLAGKEQIVSANDTTVTGHDPATGAELWSFSWPGKMPKSAQPIPAGENRIIVTSSYGMKSHLLEIKADGSGKMSASVVWTSSSPRTKFSSVSVVDGFAYGLDEGTIACVDMKNGDRRWRDGRYGYGQHLLVGGIMLMQAEPGYVVLVKPNAERLDEVARLPALHSMTWNPPALAGRWLLVRNDREAVCFELAARTN